MDSMKAVTSQIPVNQGQNESLSNRPQMAGDKFWAIVRRLQARIESLETGLSTARRDINRIDRKQYREASAQPPLANPPPAGNGGGSNQYDPALFGGG